MNSDKNKYLILATPPTAKYNYISSMYRCVRIYRCIGHTDIWGDALEAYICIGNVQGTNRHTGGVQMYGGMYRCMGSIQMHGDIQIYGVCRCGGHTNIWRMYGGIQMYRGIQMYGGCTDAWGCIDVGVIQTPPDIQTTKHNPTCLPTTPGYFISYKI